VSPEADLERRDAPARRRPTPVALGVGIVLAVAIIAAVAVPVVATSQASYLHRYHELQRRHTTLGASAHRGIPCVTCHGAKGGVAGVSARMRDFYSTLEGTPTLPAFTDLDPPTDAACLACHTHGWSDDASRTAQVPHPAHLRTISESRDCVSCHRWVAHEEAYQAKHTTMPFSVVCASYPCHVGTKASADCVDCHHVLHEGKDDWRTTHPVAVRANGPNGCLENCHKSAQCEECHATGKATDLPSSIPTAGVVTIEQQHVKPTWLSQHGEIALEAPGRCQTCHVSDGECLDCHSQRPAFHGAPSTWLVRHVPLAEDPAGCLTCHEQPWCDSCHDQFREKG